MYSNDLCKKLNEISHKRGSIPESQRYSVHFDYHDLVARLNKLKKELEPKPADSKISLKVKSPSFIGKDFSGFTTKNKSKYSLDGILNGKIKKNHSEKALPDLKSPLSKISPKNAMIGSHHRVLKITKSSFDFKELPKIGRKTIYN